MYWLIVIGILGSLLILSYYYFIKTSSLSITNLWGNIKGNLLNIYYLSLSIVTICFLTLFYYLIKRGVKSNKIYLTIALYLILSMFWMPMSLSYLKNKSDILKYLIILLLFLISITALVLTYLVNSIKDNSILKKVVVFGLFYLFLHSFFLDTIIWSYHFF